MEFCSPRNINLVGPPLTTSRYFHDLVVGEELTSRWYEASEKELIEFSHNYDRQYFHIDPVLAKDSPFGGLIASGTFTFAIWNKLNLEVNGDIAWIAGMGFDNFRFPNPLRPEVSFRSESHLVEKRLSDKNPNRGVVIHNYRMITKTDEILFTSTCPSLVHVKKDL